VICGPTCYQLDHGSALFTRMKLNPNYHIVWVILSNWN